MMDKRVFYIQTYQGLCILVAFSLTSWCVYEYHLDKDVSNITLRKFHDTIDDIYPSITLCHKDPFEYYLKSTEANNDKRGKDDILLRYSSFILGYDYTLNNTYDLQELRNIDYDNISVRLEDVIKQVYLTYPVSQDTFLQSTFDASGNVLVMNSNKSEKPKDMKWDDFTSFKHIDTYVSVRHVNFKCFTLDIPFIKGKTVRKVGIIFQKRSDGIDLGLYRFILTYPNQTIQVSRGNQIELDKYLRVKPTCFKFEIFVGTMEVFRRRNKRKERCNEAWKYHDEMQLNDIINEVGCNPEHWYHESEFPNCSTLEEYRKINQKYFEKDNFMPPCRSIESISKITKGTDLGWRCDKKYLEIIIYLDQERFYKEISLIAAYNFQSLIGNAGE